LTAAYLARLPDSLLRDDTAQTARAALWMLRPP